MRDYIQLFYSRESNPYIQTPVVAYYFFPTLQQCQTFIDDNPVSPGGGTLGPASPIWFRFNKPIMAGYIANSFITNIGDGGTPVLDGSGKQMIYLGESPRNLGINSKVEKKGAKNTQLGNVLDESAFQVVDNLTKLAQSLLKMRPLHLRRDGQIILYELGQTLAGRQTLTAALLKIQPILDELHRLGIT